jgi:hypothetical protein
MNDVINPINNSTKNYVHYKCDLNDLNDLFISIDKKEKDDKNKREYDELKIRIDENIKLLKEQIFQLFELTFKNKNEIENIKVIKSEFKKDVKDIKNEFEKEIEDYKKEIEDYKKITNERIEKIFKLVMIANNKLDAIESNLNNKK